MLCTLCGLSTLWLLPTILAILEKQIPVGPGQGRWRSLAANLSQQRAGSALLLESILGAARVRAGRGARVSQGGPRDPASVQPHSGRVHRPSLALLQLLAPQTKHPKKKFPPTSSRRRCRAGWPRPAWLHRSRMLAWWRPPHSRPCSQGCTATAAAWRRAQVRGLRPA